MRDHERDNGGPAFPVPNDDRPGAYEAHPGMSLRDWFAGQALEKLMDDTLHLGREEEARMIAANAYLFADAMVAERAVVRTEQVAMIKEGLAQIEAATAERLRRERQFNAMREVLARIVDIDDRDNRTDPDVAVSDEWRARAIQDARAALAAAAKET